MNNIFGKYISKCVVNDLQYFKDDYAQEGLFLIKILVRTKAYSPINITNYVKRFESAKPLLYHPIFWKKSFCKLHFHKECLAYTKS